MLAAHGCDSVQVLTSPGQWSGRDLNDQEVRAVPPHTAANICGSLSRTFYLTNLASPEESLYRRSRWRRFSSLQRMSSFWGCVCGVPPGIRWMEVRKRAWTM